jgi:predicted trehalose synthase
MGKRIMTQSPENPPTPRMEDGSEKQSMLLVLVAVSALVMWIAKVPSGHPTVPRWQRLLKRFGLATFAELLATFPDTLDQPVSSFAELIKQAQQYRRGRRP